MVALGLVDALERLRPVIEFAPAAFVAVDGDGRVTLWNPAAENLFGWSQADVLGRPDPSVAGLGPLARESSGATVRRIRRDGVAVDLRMRTQPVVDPDGTTTGTLSVYALPSGVRAPEHALAARSRHQAGVVALGELALSGASAPAVWAEAVRIVSDCLDVPAVALLRATPPVRGSGTGWGLVTAAALPDDGRWPDLWTPGRPVGVGLGPAARALLRRTSIVSDVDDLHPGESERLVAEGLQGVAAVLVGRARDPWGVLVVATKGAGVLTEDDVWFLRSIAATVAAADERRAVEAEIRHRATHDALTSLPNRELCLQRLTELLDEGRIRGTASALLLLDLDGFKDVNDSRGHASGDEVLVQVADRARVAVGARGMVARLGGDEFAVLVGEVTTAADAQAVADDLLAALQPPLRTRGGPVRIGGSVGIALAPRHGNDPTTLLMRADLAMYRAKRERLRTAFYDSSRDHDASDRLTLVSELRTAIADGTLGVAYQPLVRLDTHAVWGVEALARWSSERLGPQRPAEFVRAAEQAGLIDELTLHVVRTAVAQAAEWLRTGRRLRMSVNVSPIALAAPGLASELLALVHAHRLPPDTLRLEVTEGSLAHDPAVSALRHLVAQGVEVALDDFGTGYSSLSRLKHLPVTMIKIDGSFVRDVADDPRDAALVGAVVGLARRLDLLVTAEGVETPRTAQAVTDLGVHVGQGLLYAPAMPAARFEAWAAGWADGPWPCCGGVPAVGVPAVGVPAVSVPAVSPRRPA